MDFKYTLLIKEAHLDTFGHVNNATYLQIYEEARWDLITNNGYGLKQVQELKQGPVITEVNLKFMKELKLRETITVKTEMVDYPGKIGHLKQQMIKPNGDLASEAIFTFGLFDLSTRKLIEPTPAWKKAVGWTV
jgi:YbgC/YbaW family acyl-CoA thioester hydrolase